MTWGLGAFDPIAWWGRVAPERTALVDRARALRLSYSDLDVLANQWAALLQSEGVASGDRVAVISANRHEYVALLFACARSGAALVPLNWRLAEPELRAILSDASPALVVAESRFTHLATAVPDATWLTLDAGGDEDAGAMGARLRQAGAPVIAPVQAESTAMVLYTSGSTGRPKGAMLSHRQLLFNAIATSIGWELGAGDVGPVTTPFFHVGGWNVFATPLWLQGGTVVLFESFEASEFLGALAEEECTVAFGVPTQFVMLAESPDWGRALPRLRWMISGGAPCPAALAARVREAGYALREGFGMTEFGCNCFAITDAAALAKPGAVGWPMPFVEMRLVDEADRILGDGVVGEMQLRGPQLFSGYLHDPAQSRDALTGDGWLRTGDLALRDGDGAYFIRGRRKQMFISGGENVYPGEVEAALADCAGVAESVVIGVAHPQWGEVGHAFVQPRAGATVAAPALLAELRQRLAAYKVPKQIEVVATLPRTGSGKVDRQALELRMHTERAQKDSVKDSGKDSVNTSVSNTQVAKGAAVQSTLDFARADGGDAAVERVLQALDPALRARVTGVGPTGEIDYADLIALWDALLHASGNIDSDWMTRSGAYSIESRGSQLYGGILRKRSPTEFLTQGVSLFRLFYHPGDMTVVEEGLGRAVLRLVGFDVGSAAFCQRQTGGLCKALEIAGGEDPVAHHVRCTLEGDAFCEWELRWTQPA